MDGFQFQRFYVQHAGCAMKVGTDGVLLGAWAPLSGLSDGARLLDIGTGSGLIALMLAQRLEEQGRADWQVEAIDIAREAAAQAAHNFAQSPWAAQLEAREAALQQWQGRYDMIVSNPPYFVDALRNPDEGRALARHTDSLPFAELMQHAARMLTASGRLCLVLPAEAESAIRREAARVGLFLTRVARVYSKESKPCRRLLLCLERTVGEVKEERLVLMPQEGNGRSEAYQALTKNFYLN